MAVLHACVAAGRHEQAFEIFAQLKLGGFAARDATILLPLMAAAKHLGEPRAAALFDNAVAAGMRPSAALLGAALIDAYAGGGDVRGAFDAFGRVAERERPPRRRWRRCSPPPSRRRVRRRRTRARSRRARGVTPTDALRSLLLKRTPPPASAPQPAARRARALIVGEPKGGRGRCAAAASCSAVREAGQLTPGSRSSTSSRRTANRAVWDRRDPLCSEPPPRRRRRRGMA